MSVLNPRNRLVNFRLSEVEFEKLKAVCFERGARSISEFARTAVLQSLDQPTQTGLNGTGQMQQLNQKVSDLEVRVEQLLRLITVVGMSSLERSVASPLPTQPQPVAAGSALPHN